MTPAEMVESHPVVARGYYRGLNEALYYFQSCFVADIGDPDFYSILPLAKQPAKDERELMSPPLISIEALVKNYYHANIISSPSAPTHLFWGNGIVMTTQQERTCSFIIMLPL